MSFWKRSWSKRAEPKQGPVVEETGAEPMGEPSEALPVEPEVSFAGVSLSDLLPELKRLDRLLEQAVAAAQSVYGTKAAVDPFRGLHISQSEVEHLLARAPGVPILRTPTEQEETLPKAVREGSRLDWLKQVFGLTPFEIYVILLSLAPELDLRYERIYAYLQDDVTRRRPSVDLALNLLSPNPDAKLANRVHFAPEAVLIRHNLIHLIADPQQMHPPLLSHYLKLDDQIIRLLLEHQNLDARLAPFCEIVEPSVSMDNLPLSGEMKKGLPALVLEARQSRQPLRLYFQGMRGIGKRRTAEALAGEAGMSLLAVDLARALAADPDFDRQLKLLFREAWLQDAILYLDGLEALLSGDRPIPYQRLLDRLADNASITILTGTQPWVPVGHRPIGMIGVPFVLPQFTERRACWQDNLTAAGIMLEPNDLDGLADRFRLTPLQIAEAVATAHHRASLQTTGEPPEEALSQSSIKPGIDDLFAAARTQSGHDLKALARQIEPKYVWADIVLPEDTLAQLREVCQRVAHQQRVLGEWGFGQKISLGKGVNALFAGPSGTGKTMAAEIIANELRLDVYKIDLSAVVSKYIGETEKNLERIFTTAENANAILFFDEADALFGKRSEVRDSHDRYANVEISYLLQKMEEYEGIAILATNLRQNLDESFVRRLTFTVHFPAPDEASRRRIWEKIWPAETPRDADLDLDFLGRQFKLSGGNIKNVALAAAFLAAEDDSAVTMAHLVRATRREYQKLGKPLTEAELGPFALGASA